jgi:hypothetical protein
MNDQIEGIGRGIFTSDATLNGETRLGSGTEGDSFPKLPEGRRQLPTDMPNSRLYLIKKPDGAVSHWEAETLLNSGLVHRRFASELHARAWLYLASGPQTMSESTGPGAVEESFRFRP